MANPWIWSVRSGKCRGPLVHPRTHLKLMHFDTMWWTAEEDTDERPERVDVESERKFSSGTNRPSMALSSLQFVFLDDHVIKLTTRELNTWVERCPAALSLTIHSTTYCVKFANWTLFRDIVWSGCTGQRRQRKSEGPTNATVCCYLYYIDEKELLELLEEKVQQRKLRENIYSQSNCAPFITVPGWAHRWWWWRL